MTPIWAGSRYPIVALGRVVDIQLGKMLQPASSTVGDEATPYLRAGTLSKLGTSEFPEMFASPQDRKKYGIGAGDLLVAEGGDVGRAEFAGVIPPHAIIQNSLHRIRSATADIRYVKYVLDAVYGTGWLDVYCNKSTFGHLTREKLAALPVPLPSLQAQAAIADYLDVETTRIDALIQRRHDTAGLLLIRFDVSTRIQVAADTAGMPYPVIPLRRRWRVIDCKHRTPDYVIDGYPIVSPGDATPGRLDLSRCTRFVDDHDFVDLTEGPRLPQRGDIIYTRNASIGIASYVDTDAPFSMGQDVCLIRSTEQDQRYLTYVLNTLGLDQLAEQKIGSTFSRINVAQVLDLSVPCPPLAEQRRIVEALGAEGTRMSKLLAVARRHVDLLMERREAVIIAAVTGQLELAMAVA